jgi:serine/threonine protein kinase
MSLNPPEPSNSFPEAEGGHPQIPDYELLRSIGKSSFGEVWLARNVLGYRRGQDCLPGKFRNGGPFEREFNGIQNFERVSRSHEGLVDVLHAGRGNETGYFYYVMELADDASAMRQCAEKETWHLVPETYKAKTLKAELEQRGRLPFDECLQISVLLTSALAHLHKHKLVHRDIKPATSSLWMAFLSWQISD